MILIVTKQTDISTYEVIRWLEYFGAKYTLINDNTKVKWHELIINNDKTEFKFYKNNVFMSSYDYHVCWMRRFLIRFDFNVYSKYTEVTENLKIEAETIIDYIHFQFETKKSLGTFFNKNANKLQALELAKKAGLLIPNSSVITNINSLKKSDNKQITKVIGPGFPFSVENKKYGCSTELVNLKKISENEINLFPSLIQTAINKRYEIRVFYLDGKMYGMAIFSQKDSKTKVDFRNYNYENPNRCVPFSLPNMLKKQIKKFMRSYNLNTGSLDFIYTTDHKFVFLEVNPVGQFDFLSKRCNYSIEKEIAQFLITNDHE